MSSRYVHNTLRAYFEANWTDCRIVDVQNLFQTPAGDPLTEWATMFDQDAVENQVSLGAVGNQRWREEGTIAFIVYVPSGTGMDRARELAEKLRNLFRAKLIDDGAGGPTIVIRQADPPDTALPSSVDASSGAWYGFVVSVTYYCDFCRVT